MHYSIVITDDHQLFSNALAELLGKDGQYEVLYSAANGKELQEKFKNKRNIPDLLLLDINMPEMDGFATAEWLKLEHPDLKFLALSMNNSDHDILKMLKAGASGYLLKDSSPDELLNALRVVREKGFYHSELVASHLMKMLKGESSVEENDYKLSEREKQFLQFACSEFSYKEIADKMCVAERTVDGYRESLFNKLGVRTRVGLAMFAIKNKLVNQ